MSSRRRGLVVLVAAAAVASGCGTPSADLFVVSRTGSIPGGELSLLVRDDGTARCNGGDARAIGDDRLLTARELARDLREPAERGVSLAPQAGSIMRYRVRVEEGTVSFSDTSRRQPGAFFRVAAFARAIARDVCGLRR